MKELEKEFEDFFVMDRAEMSGIAVNEKLKDVWFWIKQNCEPKRQKINVVDKNKIWYSCDNNTSGKNIWEE